MKKPKRKPAYADLADLDEDKRINIIGNHVLAGNVVGAGIVRELVRRLCYEHPACVFRVPLPLNPLLLTRGMPE